MALMIRMQLQRLRHEPLLFLPLLAFYSLAQVLNDNSPCIPKRLFSSRKCNIFVGGYKEQAGAVVTDMSFFSPVIGEF